MERNREVPDDAPRDARSGEGFSVLDPNAGTF